MCTMKKIRKDITLSPETYNKGKLRAKELGISFSSYISLLINKEV